MPPLVGTLLRQSRNSQRLKVQPRGPCRTAVPEKVGAGLQAHGKGHLPLTARAKTEDRYSFGDPVLSCSVCPTLCDPVDCSPPGSSVRGISQARILEWAAIPSSRGSSLPTCGPMSLTSPAFGRWVLYRCAAQEAGDLVTRKVRVQPLLGIMKPGRVSHKCHLEHPLKCALL